MRGITVAVMVIGVLALAVSLLADRIGIGASGGDFGWKQMLGALLGAGLLFGGARGRWECMHPDRETGRGERKG